MKIRRATHEDADEIARVNIEGWRTAYRNLLPADYLANLSYDSRKNRWSEILSEDAKDKITFVAEASGKVIGFASCGSERTGDPQFAGEIYAIYLLKEYHGRGIGTALYLNGVRFLLEHGMNSMKVWVLRDNPYRPFYERHGGEALEEKVIAIGESELIGTAYGWRSLERYCEGAR